MTLGIGVVGVDLVARVRLLADGRAHRAQAGVLMVLALAVLVLPTAFVVTPWVVGL